MYIAFFHISDDYIEEFSNKDGRPLFYWFSDSYHSHCGIGKYFYLFVKDINEVNFTTRHDQCGLDSLLEWFNDFKKEREIVFNRETENKYAEPSIMVSKSKLKPDLTLKKEDECFIIVKPEQNKNIKIKLFNKMPQDIFDLFKGKYRPINFLEIDEIVKIAPNIQKAQPFASNI